MDIREIRQLVKLMVDNDLRELDIADGDKSIHLKRGREEAPAAAAPAAPVAPAAPAPKPAEEAPAEEPAPALIDIKSPMVGTFYTAASPDSEIYAEVGDDVEPDTVVCIVEAMKVMNEIRAECTGTIVEVCVQNAHPVEFGQVLFRVRPG